MQKPSVGRAVHYCHSGRRVPATIERVNSDSNVDLALNIANSGGVLGIASSSLAEESLESAGLLNEMLTPHGTWSWPPRVG